MARSAPPSTGLFRSLRNLRAGDNPAPTPYPITVSYTHLIDEVRISSKFSAAGAWTIMIKYIAPVLVIIILVAYVAAQFGFFSM